MPEQATLKRAQRDKGEGKAASTQAGEFVKEEMDHIGLAIAVGIRDRRNAICAKELPAGRRHQPSARGLQKAL